jgi:hypothetical protein
MGALGGLRELLNATSRNTDSASDVPRASGTRTAASTGLGYPDVPKSLTDGGSTGGAS